MDRVTTTAVWIGWLLGIMPATFGAASSKLSKLDMELALWQLLLFTPPLRVVAGVLLGAAQWSIMRRHVTFASRWIGANAIGWALAIVSIFIGAALPDLTTSIVFSVGTGLASGLAGGAVVGAITGACS